MRHDIKLANAGLCFFMALATIFQRLLAFRELLTTLKAMHLAQVQPDKRRNVKQGRR